MTGMRGHGIAPVFTLVTAITAVIAAGVGLVILSTISGALGPAPNAVIPQGGVRNGSVTYFTSDSEMILPAYHVESTTFSSLNFTFYYQPTGKPFNASVIMGPADGNADLLLAFPALHVNASGIGSVSVPRSSFEVGGQLIPVSIGLAGGNGSVVYFGNQQIQRTVNLGGGGLTFWPVVEIVIGASIILLAIFLYVEFTSGESDPKTTSKPSA